MTRTARPIERRALLLGTAAACASLLAPGRPRAAEGSLLDPGRIGTYALPPLQTAQIDGGKATYALQGPQGAPLLLYFHGWGDDYRIVLPIEYPLIDAGFAVLVAHRPGYAGTALYGHRIDRRTAAGSARIAAALLDQVRGGGRWRVGVIGTSGGAPAALAFAAQFPRQTAALVIQAGVTQPWTEARYVPDVLRESYLTAFRRFGWAGNRVSKAIFGLLAKLRENFLDDEDKIRALAGPRLPEIKLEVAYRAVVSMILREFPGNGLGELNDARSIFFAKSPYAHWHAIRAPVLLIHDPADPFVPVAHAEEALRQLPAARLEGLHLGGHMIWLGRDAQAMHAARVAFLRRHL